MKYCIIFNPGARDGKSKKNLPHIKEYFSKHTMDYDLIPTKNLDHAYHLSVTANKKGYDSIIAVGGDGTINRVLNGFYNESGKRISSTTLGVIYTGTSPDFCKSYNIPYKDLYQSLNTIKQGKSKKIRIGKIILAEQPIPGKNRVIKNSSSFITCYFGCCANIGLGATLARYANSGIRKLCGDTIGTFVSLIKTLTIYHPIDLTWYSDGIKQRADKIYNISIGKTYYIASGIKVKNDLKPHDSRFYHLLVKNLTLSSLPSCIKALYDGKKIMNSGTISLSHNNTFEIESPGQSIEVEFDGDPRGFLPCHIEMATDSLDLIVEHCNE